MLVACCGCRTLDDSGSAVKIVQGELIAEAEQPAVVAIGQCTASFIAPRVLLTARHCRFAAYRGVRVRYMLRPTGSMIAAVRPDDLQLFVLERDAAPAILSLAIAPAQVGDRVTLIGYGCTGKNLGDHGRKRRGVNAIAVIRGGDDPLATMLETSTSTATPELAATCAGDSGGPMLNAAGEIVGVTSGGDFTVDGTGKVSLHVNMTAPAVRRFLGAAVATGVTGPIDGVAAAPGEELVEQIELALP